MPSAPVLSVVIPTFNRAPMVKRCVASVLASEGVDLECIVVDDHSPDDTGDVLREAFGADPRFRYLRQECNSFQATARNAGAQIASGEFLLFLDDDNTIAPDMCGRLVEALRTHPELGLAAPVSIHVLPDGRREIWTLGSDFNRRTSQPKDSAPRSREADIPANEPLLPTTYSPNAFCVPRTVYDEVGGFDESFVQIFEESDFGWRVLATGRTAAIVPAARTDHHGFLEPGCVPALRALGIEKPFRTRCFARNRIWFVRRHFPLSGKLSVILLFAPLSVLWYGAVALRNGRPGIAWAYLRGTLRGVFSRLPAPPSPIVRSITAKPSDCTIVVAGCDKYADLLAPFSALWRQFWPDCPYRVVLVTETAPTEGKLCFDEVFAMGDGHSWGWRLSRALAHLATPRVILLCDDYFLCGRVDTGRIAARVRQSLEADALNLRLIPNPATMEPWPADPTLGRYRKNTAYCISTLAGIWDREFLAGLSGKTESIWEFERQGSYSFPGDEGRPLLCTREQDFPFVDAVHKGHWEKFGVRLCRERNVPIDLSARTLPPFSRRLVEWAKGVVFRISPGLIVRIQNRFGLGHKEAKRQ